MTAAANSASERAGRGTPVQRLRVGALSLVSRVACRLPERPLLALADVVGWLWYRLAPAPATPALVEPAPDAVPAPLAGTEFGPS